MPYPYRRNYKRKWIPYERYKAMQRYKRTGYGTRYTARSYAKRRSGYKPRSRRRYVNHKSPSFAQSYSSVTTRNVSRRKRHAKNMSKAPFLYRVADAISSFGKYYSFVDPTIGGAMVGGGKFVKSVFEGNEPDPVAGLSNFGKLYDHFLG